MAWILGAVALLIGGLFVGLLWDAWKSKQADENEETLGKIRDWGLEQVAANPIPTAAEFRDEVLRHITYRDDGKIPWTAISSCIVETAEKLYDFEKLNEIPPIPEHLGTQADFKEIDRREYRRMVEAALSRRTPEVFSRMARKAAACMDEYVKRLPASAFVDSIDDGDTPLFTTEVATVQHMDTAVMKMVIALTHPNPITDNPFIRFGTQFHENTWDAKKGKSKTADLTGTDYIVRSFHSTPLMGLFSAQVPFEIPEFRRFEHQWIVAPPGTGKTVLLSAFINEDLKAVYRAEASLIVMESNRDLIDGIRKLRDFGPGGSLEGKLIVIDPEDVEYPVAINLFDVGLDQIQNASPRDREALLNSAVAMLEYIFRGLLGAELTSRQSTLFNFTIQLLLQIPGATLDTLIDLMQPGGIAPYQQYVLQLDRDAQRFFTEKFDAPGGKGRAEQFADTKAQVTDRLYAVKRIRTLARMFSAERTRLNLYEEMGKGKVILINAAKSLLQEEGVEIFGRFWLAMILLAAEKRQLLSRTDRMPCFVYIDEAQDIIRRDEKLPVLLDQARKFRVGMILAHQRLDHMTPPVLSALYSSTAIKFASRLSDANASALARNMNTTAEFIEKQRDHHFAAFVRGYTAAAVSLEVPHVDFALYDHMSPADQEDIQEDMRERYSIPIDEATDEEIDEPAYVQADATPKPPVERESLLDRARRLSLAEDGPSFVAQSPYAAKPAPREPRAPTVAKEKRPSPAQSAPQPRASTGAKPPEDDKPQEW